MMPKSEEVRDKLKLSGWTVDVLDNTLMMYPQRYKILISGAVEALDKTSLDVVDIVEYLESGYVGSYSGSKDTRLYDLFNVEILKGAK